MRTIDADALKEGVDAIPITTNDAIMVCAWEAFKRRVTGLIDCQPTIAEGREIDNAD